MKNEVVNKFNLLVRDSVSSLLDKIEERCGGGAYDPFSLAVASMMIENARTWMEIATNPDKSDLDENSFRQLALTLRRNIDFAEQAINYV